MACNEAGVKFIVYLIHHQIATPALKGDYALNSVLVSFNFKFLAERDAHGVVIIDRLPGDKAAFAMLKAKFQDGLSNGSKLNRVVLYATTCDGASHLSSAVDIVLGAFRWVVNARDKPVQGSVERQLMAMVASMMYANQADGVLCTCAIGGSFSGLRP